jgi:hypothetical protein
LEKKMIRAEWREKLATLVKKFENSSWRVWAAALFVCGLIAVVWDLSHTEKTFDARDRESPESAATYIPAGFVLIPIEVENYEALDSILGKFGVVDLYKPAEKPGARPRKIASHVKILRAPLNPSHFAVLAPETQSQSLVAYSGAFTVVVQNPRQSGTSFEEAADTASEANSQPHRRSRILVEVNDAG